MNKQSIALGVMLSCTAGLSNAEVDSYNGDYDTKDRKSVV